MLTNWNIAPVLAGSVVLAVFDRRYMTGIVILAPLFLVHTLSGSPGARKLHFVLRPAMALAGADLGSRAREPNAAPRGRR